MSGAPQDYDCDVLISGLGPTGIALALLLTGEGVSVIAVERATDVHPLPRAAHFDHEIMRLFQHLQVLDGIRSSIRAAPPYEFRAANGSVLLRFDPDASGSPSGWSTGYMIHQPGIERALRAALATSDLADLRLGHTLNSLACDADGVTAGLSSPSGRSTVRARYLIGCDGASSCVRNLIGVELDDYGFDEPWLVIDALAPDPEAVPEVNLQICDPRRPTTCVLTAAGRHRWEFMMLPGETTEQVLDDRFIATLLAPWNAAGLTIDRKAVYRFHAVVARSWREGRVLLAGDAAHQMPPFAGQGMCSGLRDAANLAWKIKAVLRRGVADDLLDTYQPEREPHVRAYIDFAIGMGRVVCTLDRDAAERRDVAMLAARAQGGSLLPPIQSPVLGASRLLAASPGAGELFPQPWGRAAETVTRLDDVLGHGAWLIGAADQEPSPALLADIRVFALDAPLVAPFRAALEAWLATRGADAVLVRPDRYVFGTGRPGALLAAYDAAFVA